MHKLILGCSQEIWFGMRQPLSFLIPQYFIVQHHKYSQNVVNLCRSSLMSSIQSFELDDNCIVSEIFPNDEWRFHQATRLTHIRISFLNFEQCIYLLNQLGSQLHSFIVTVFIVCNYQSPELSKIRSVSGVSGFNILN